MDGIRLYDVTVDSECYAISLVTDPAIEMDFVALKKAEPLQIALEGGKMAVVGAVLVPGKPIYRNDEYKGEYYIRFSEETIERLAHDYLMSGRIYSFTTQHEEVADGVAVVESWISQGGGEYGIEAPKGTWMVMAKFSDKGLWERVKSGELRGFSIEAMAGLEQAINEKIYNNMETKDTKMEAVEVNDGFWNKLKEILAGILAGSPAAPAEAIAEEAVEEAKAEAEPAPENLEKEAKAEEKLGAAEEAVQEAVAEATETVEEKAGTEEDKIAALQAVIDGLEAKLAEKEARIAELEKDNEKLSRQPSAKPAGKGSPEAKDARKTIEALYEGTYFNKK